MLSGAILCALHHLTVRGTPMAVGKVSDADFESEVLKANGPVVVDFWAEWCGPCRMIAPALDEIAGAMGDKVKIVKLNVDENPETASRYGVMSIPTLMIFKGGEMASRRSRSCSSGSTRRSERSQNFRRYKAGETIAGFVVSGA